MLRLNEDEVFEIKKTSGLSEVVSQREAGFFPLFDGRVYPLGKDENGYFRRETAWEKRSAQPY